MDDLDKNLTIIEIRLKHLRNVKMISQEKLAKDLNLTRTTINSWENGYRNISIKQLMKVSHYFGVPIDYILGLTTNYDKKDYKLKEELDLKYFGNKIRLIRKLEGLTQEEFASKIHTNKSNISFYEIGKGTMTSADLKEICNTFGYSADWCVGNIEKCIRRKPNIIINELEIKQFIEL